MFSLLNAATLLPSLARANTRSLATDANRKILNAQLKALPQPRHVAPKRPANAYGQFVHDQFPKFKKDHPPKQVMSLLAKEWKTVDQKVCLSLQANSDMPPLWSKITLISLGDANKVK